MHTGNAPQASTLMIYFLNDANGHDQINYDKKAKQIMNFDAGALWGDYLLAHRLLTWTMTLRLQ